jgi:hypothetical protein
MENKEMRSINVQAPKLIYGVNPCILALNDNQAY